MKSLNSCSTGWKPPQHSLCEGHVEGGVHSTVQTDLTWPVRLPHICPSAPRRHSSCHQRFRCHASRSEAPTLFPRSYEEAIQQAQDATQCALSDGKQLLEVEFPTASLASVSGDAEGANEMNYNMGYLRRYCRVFELMGLAECTRLFFPDQTELRTALEGRAMDPAAGAAEIGPTFKNSRLQLDFLMTPTGLMDFGIDLNKRPVLEKVKDTDKLFVIAYPHFNVDEILYVEELWRMQSGEKRPIVVFNGELDRIRSGYYPSFFYPKIGKISKSFIPQFTQVYYIHNFKGSSPGALFRCYPGPWQVLKRSRRHMDQVELVEKLDEMPSLKEVAMNILPMS